MMIGGSIIKCKASVERLCNRSDIFVNQSYMCCSVNKAFSPKHKFRPAHGLHHSDDTTFNFFPSRRWHLTALCWDNAHFSIIKMSVITDAPLNLDFMSPYHHLFQDQIAQGCVKSSVFLCLWLHIHWVYVLMQCVSGVCRVWSCVHTAAQSPCVVSPNWGTNIAVVSHNFLQISLPLPVRRMTGVAQGFRCSPPHM